VTMKSWLALVVSPTIALATQSTLYSMVTPSCSAQTRLQLHIAAAVALTVVVVMAVLAFSESSLRRDEPASHDSDEGHAHVRRRFLATMASAVAALSALVILGMWFALWVLTPCEP
jgi:hypothetical protein